LVVPGLADDNRWIIAFKKDASFDFAKSYVSNAGAKIVLEQPAFPFVAAVIEDADLVQKLGLLDFVDFVEEDVRRYPISINPSSLEGRLQAIAAASRFGNLTDSQVTPYGIPMVQANLVTDSAAGTQTVCIIDSGYNLGHEDLPSNTVNGLASSNWNTDGCNHGTHVAGTIAALDNTVGVVGVLPHSVVKLYIVRVFGNDCAWTYSSGLADAGTKCQQAGATVISMSLGSAAPSVAEQTTFDALYDTGNIISVAAAGNSGTTANSYPAGYAGVISVAAVDSSGTRASFSQYNANVEISAPGVAVLSSVSMGTGESSTWSVGSSSYSAISLNGDTPATQSPKGDSGNVPFCNCGLGTAVCNCKNSVCLVQRGTNNFAEKVLNCQAGGALAAVIYNNVAGSFTGTLGAVTTIIPSVTASLADGQAALAQLAANPSVQSRVAVLTSNYEYYDGTSMATPHASAVIALVWSRFPSCTNAGIRKVIQNSATQLGGYPQGARNVYYGFGLIQAQAAVTYITNNGCAP